MVPALLITCLNHLLSKECVCMSMSTQVDVLDEISNSNCWVNTDLQVKPQGSVRASLSLALVSTSNVSCPS